MSESPTHGSTGEPPDLHGAWKASELAHRIMWVVWPAFLVAGFAEIVFFTLVDPEELHFFGDTLDGKSSSRVAQVLQKLSQST